jgi:hypothetical protein
MMALQEMREFRLFALPPIYNFMRSTLHPSNSPNNPVMYHTHTFSNNKLNISNYKDIAKHSVMLTFDDCFHRMKLFMGPYPFFCDILVA